MFALLRELSNSTRVSGASNANFSSSDNLEFLTKLELQISSPRGQVYLIHRNFIQFFEKARNVFTAFLFCIEGSTSVVFNVV